MLPRAKKGPKGITSLRPFNLNNKRKALITPATIKAIISAPRVLFKPKNAPSANINLMSPPPIAPGIKANRKSKPPPTSIPSKALVNEISLASKNNIPIANVRITIKFGIILCFKSTTLTIIKIETSTTALKNNILNPNLKKHIKNSKTLKRIVRINLFLPPLIVPDILKEILFIIKFNKNPILKPIKKII